MAAIAAAGLENMYMHFLLRRKSWAQGGRTCSMCFQGREVRYHTYYLLVMERRLFRNVSVWDPWHN